MLALVSRCCTGTCNAYRRAALACTPVVMPPVVADLFKGFLGQAIQNPFKSFCVLAVLYLVWVPFGGIYALIALGVGPILSTIICTLLLVVFSRFIAQFMIFPCSVPYVSKGIEKGVAIQMRSKVDQSLVQCAKAIEVSFCVRCCKQQPANVVWALCEFDCCAGVLPVDFARSTGSHSRSQRRTAVTTRDSALVNKWLIYRSDTAEWLDESRHPNTRHLTAHCQRL
jgi:hypothetical protein